MSVSRWSVFFSFLFCIFWPLVSLRKRHFLPWCVFLSLAIVRLVPNGSLLTNPLHPPIVFKPRVSFVSWSLRLLLSVPTCDLDGVFLCVFLDLVPPHFQADL